MSENTPSVTDNLDDVLTASRAVLGAELTALIDSYKDDPRRESRLIAVLHAVQGQNGYLGENQLDAVAQLMQIPAATVSGVASFYHYFRLKPRGLFMINVCLGTACYVKGADRVAQRIMDELGISWGETSGDNVFTLEGTRCLGACGLAPIVMVNEDVHPNVTPDQVPLILDEYLRKSREMDR